MKTFSEFLLEEKHKEEKIPEFFAHYRSGKDKKHDVKSHEEDETPEFFAHYRSGKDKKHDPLDEDFQWKHDKTSRKELNDNLKSLNHHKDLMNDEIKSDNTNEHRTHVVEYTNSSKDLNRALLKKTKLDSEQKNQVKALDKATTNPKNALKKPIKTYSGVGANFAKTLSKVKPGQHVRSPAYISSSLDHNIARSFWEQSGTKTKKQYHVIQFHLPKGYSKGRYIHNKFHATPGEHEVLIARGQKFRKIKQTKVDHHNDLINSSAIIHHLEPVDD